MRMFTAKCEGVAIEAGFTDHWQFNKRVRKHSGS